ncbi:MAG: hypothetical protein O3A49_05930 [Candidatus Marinimicrobia bacterium]|nr:hypothetical protein [Candidatus Neomarinimicrobiota bacterium]
MNVLILGCSFSSGSYVFAEGRDDKEKLNSYIGWWNFVEYLKNHHKTIFSFSGMGWTAYNSLLYNLEENNKLSEYDICIIQETFEPRFSILKPNVFQNIQPVYENKSVKHYNFSLADSILHDRRWYVERLNKNYNLNANDNFIIDYNKSSSKWPLICGSKCFSLSLLDKHNIPTYLFSAYDSLLVDCKFKKIIDLKITNVWLRMSKYHTYKWIPNITSRYAPHITIDGNKEIGKIINEHRIL